MSMEQAARSCPPSSSLLLSLRLCPLCPSRVLSKEDLSASILGAARRQSDKGRRSSAPSGSAGLGAARRGRAGRALSSAPLRGGFGSL